MSKHTEILRLIRRNSKQLVVTVLGGAIVLAGLALLVLPGPGIIVVALGFAILATEYAWAARAQQRTREAAQRAGRQAKERLRRTRKGTRGDGR